MAGITIILVGVLASSVQFLCRLRNDVGSAYGLYRVGLGRAILLGLEFLIAGDIIRTVATSPTFQSLIQVTGLQASGDQLRIASIVSDGSQLVPTESPAVSIAVDRVAGTATARLRGNDVTLRLAPAGW